MKKLFLVLALFGLMTSVSANTITTNDSEVILNDILTQEMDEGSDQEDLSQEPIGFTQEAKKRFIEGGPGFMGIVLICLILGLAISIE